MVMSRPTLLPAVVLSVALLGGPGLLDIANASGPIGRARELLEGHQAAGAVKCLENALATTDQADRPELLALLRRAYLAAAEEAEAGGHAHEALLYRDNLEILGREVVAPQTAAPAPPPSGPNL